VAMGYFEVYLNPLTSSGVEKKFFPHQSPGIQIQNPITEEQTELRQEILTGLLELAKENAKESDQGRFFCFAKAYFPTKEEKKKFALLWVEKEKNFSKDQFLAWKADIEKIRQEWNRKGLDFQAGQHPAYLHCTQPQYSFTLNQDKKIYAWGGKLHPAFLQQTFSKSEVGSVFCYAEWDWDGLFALPEKEIVYVDLFKFPPALFDLTLILPIFTSFASVKEKIFSFTMPEITEVHYLDVYLPKNTEKKNLTIQITFRSGNKTFSAQELSGLQNALMKKLEKAGFTLRKPEG